MAKIHYSSDGVFAQTPCPFGKKTGWGTVKVNSHSCTHSCRYYSSTDYKNKYVVCLADCASRLRAILDRIDFVIANDKCDDIVFEDFLAEIREVIAGVLDGES